VKLLLLVGQRGGESEGCEHAVWYDCRVSEDIQGLSISCVGHNKCLFTKTGCHKLIMHGDSTIRKITIESSMNRLQFFMT
jgi:hypothetical protein